MTRLLGVLFVALLVAGCGNSEKTLVSPGEENIETAERKHLEERESQIATFAEAIHSLSVTVKKNKVNLKLTYRNVDHRDDKGKPMYTWFSLEGVLGTDLKASLVRTELATSYHAEIICESARCEAYSLKVEKKEGAHTGIAVIRSEKYDGKSLELFRNTESLSFGADKTLNWLRDTQVGSKSYSITRVDGGKSFFEMNFVLSNELLSKGTPEYFTEGWVRIFGELGKGVKVRIADYRFIQYKDTETGYTSASNVSVLADTGLSENIPGVSVNFLDSRETSYRAVNLKR